MTFDFSNIQAPPEQEKIIHPVELFQKNKGKILDNTINDLWLAQGDALREWHDNRAQSDIGLILNTGAGKTLIGLLLAQSLANETNGKVLFACGSIQLVEQTRDKALAYGMEVTTYFRGNFSNNLFQQGQAACLTTYQAIFNGRSVFARQEIEAIIFDDAHTAESVIKGQFSIELNLLSTPQAVTELIELFRGYYQKVGKLLSFAEIAKGENSAVELLPPTIVRGNLAAVHQILLEHGINELGGNKFSWPYLKDHLDLCSYFVSAGHLQVIPPFLPMSSLPYFRQGVRRIYLSATMLGADSFLRTFGRNLDVTIQPETSAGECERLILVPGEKFGYVNDGDVDITKEVIENSKVLVLTPSFSRAAKWNDVAVLPDREQVSAAIDSFRGVNSPGKLVLAARYDGIDLPGDTCRVLVLDSLPSGSSLFDRYMWSALRLANTLRTAIACRVVQSMGRISRGMSDHGAVFFTGKSYVDWLRVPKNMSALPGFIQKQFALGFQITDNVENVAEFRGLLEQFLARDNNWQKAYENFLASYRIPESADEMESLVECATAEVKFSKHYWERNFIQAAQALESVLDIADDISAGLCGWYCLWIGYCYEILEEQGAEDYYQRSWGLCKALPRKAPAAVDLSEIDSSSQVQTS